MDMNRRDFTRLSMAVFGGMVAGSTVGCGGGDPPKPGAKPTPTPTPPDAGPGPVADAGSAAAAKELHVCRGLNSCKGKGKSGDNACAGQGTCSTVKEHACGGINECKGQGGCDEKPGANDCKGMGACHVPLANKESWEKARTLFEERMKAANKEVGPAPEPEKKG